MTTGRRLRILTRREPRPGESGMNWTVFARLSPPVAQALHDDICRESVSQSTLEFLPLLLSGMDEPVYVSYNGGSIAENDSIELAAGTVPEGVTHVTVTPIPHIPDAVSVEVEPFTTSDWESLEVYAERLEEGDLLQQVSVVYPNQKLAIHVGTEMVRVRVHCDAPNRLVANTQVYVRPKPRQQPHPMQNFPLLRVVPSWDDFSTDMQELAVRTKEYSPIPISPCTLLVHPTTLENVRLENGSIVVFRKSKPGDTQNSEMCETAVARVDTSELVPEGSVVLHRLLRYQLDIIPLFDYVCLQPASSIDSSFVLTMVTSGSLSLSLEEVGFIDSPTDYECPWRYPDASRRRGPLFKPSEHRMETCYLSQLRSILASWLDLSDGDRELPLCPGSLISQPWTPARDGQTIYRLVAHLSTETDSLRLSAESVCVRAKDLPDLLLKSSSAVSKQWPPEERQKDQKFISVNEREHLLNMIPSTADLSLDTSSELASTLTNNLECFDTMVLSGEVGSGKTHTALVLAARARLTKTYATFYLDCKKLQSSCDVRMNDILQTLTQLIRDADEARPCLVVLDDLDELIPNVNMGTGEDEGSSHQQQPNPVAADQAKLIADHLQNLMDDAFKTWPQHRPIRGNVFFILTCRDEQSIHPSILSERFYRGVQVPSFNSIDRGRLFLSMLQRATGEELLSTHDVTLQGFGGTTEGFRPRDLDIVATRASHVLLQSGLSLSTCQRSDVTKAVEDAMLGYVPISRQGIHAEDTASSVTWSQVGGLFRVKDHLASTILHPVKYRRIYQHAPIRLPRGILLFGPPGCGKSFLVPALAKECGLTLITCRGPELLDKYIGASEANVRQLFQRAFAAAPCLLFMDEFDALAPVRGSDHTGVTDRVVNQLLTYLDGVEDTTAGSVYIVAATSRPDKVDPALLRPGRLEQHVFVGFPSSKEEWHSVLEQILLHRQIDSQLRESLCHQTLWEIKGATQMHFFSPADLKAVADTAYLSAVHEYLGGCDTDEEQDVTVMIQMNHVVKALQSTRPSLSVDDRLMLNRIYRPYVSATDYLDDDTEPTKEQTTGLRTALK